MAITVYLEGFFDCRQRFFDFYRGKTIFYGGKIIFYGGKQAFVEGKQSLGKNGDRGTAQAKALKTLDNTPPIW